MGQMRIKKMRVGDLKVGPGAAELADSAAPYIAAIVAGMKNEDQSAAMKVVEDLPLDKRYMWRIASGLKMAFADFDSVSVATDRQAMPESHTKEIADLLCGRPYQFCAMLAAFFGQETMERVVLNAVELTKAIHARGKSTIVFNAGAESLH